MLLDNVLSLIGELSKLEANDVLAACIVLDAIRAGPSKEGIVILDDIARVISRVSAGLAAYYTCTSVLINNGYNHDTAVNACSHVTLLSVIALRCSGDLTPEAVSSTAARLLEDLDRVVGEVQAAGFDMAKTLPCALMEKVYHGLGGVDKLIQAECRGGGNIRLVEEVAGRLSWAVER